MTSDTSTTQSIIDDSDLLKAGEAVDDPLAAIREQFDRAPYPRKPLEAEPKATWLYYHTYATAYYRRTQRFLDDRPLTILDVGCGSGFGTLALALANPGSRVIGVDLSPESVKLARQRLDHWGLSDRSEFHTLSMTEVTQLTDRFDYINCDELLYLQPDPADALLAMKAVLKPEGIIRTNLHNYHQRIDYFRVQNIARLVGLMDENPGEFEVECLADLFNSLHDWVPLKKNIWKPERAENEELVMMNFLFQRDRGFTVPQLFEYIERSGLDFISMTNWQEWDILSLFKDLDNLPAFLAMGLPMAETVDKLTLYNLLANTNRLLDCWLGHPEAACEWVPVEEWEPEDWQGAKIALHPQLQTAEFREGLTTVLRSGLDLNMDDFLPLPRGLATVSGAIALGLVPLLDGPKTMDELIQYWQQVHPIDPVSLEPTTEAQAAEPLRYLLTEFVKVGYIFIEPVS